MPILRSAIAAGIALAALVAAPVASATTTDGKRWPGTTITYWDSLPPSWDWSLRAGVRVWNDSGARIRFVRARSRGTAQVLIGMGNTGLLGGYAQQGYVPGGPATVTLTNLERVLPPRSWIPMRELIAHELGHILGLDHGPQGGCEVMDPLRDASTCGAALPGGAYRCQLLRPADVRALLRLYGGRSRRLPDRCLVQPAPAAPVDVRFTGGAGAGGPVNIHWRIARLPVGARVEVGRWRPGRCGDPSPDPPGFGARSDHDLRRTASGTWTDTFSARTPPVRHCYGIRVVNAWGLASPMVQREMDTWADVPVTPVVGALSPAVGGFGDYLVPVTIRPVDNLVVGHVTQGPCPADPSDTTYINASPTERAGEFIVGLVPAGTGVLCFYASSTAGTSPAVPVPVVHTPSA